MIAKYFAILVFALSSVCSYEVLAEKGSPAEEKIIGSWSFVPRPGDDGQRLEFLKDKSVLYLWGRTRAETESWNSDDFGPSERAVGVWKVENGKIIASFKFGEEWLDEKGRDFLTMSGQLESERQMTVSFKTVRHGFKAWNRTEKLVKE